MQNLVYGWAICLKFFLNFEEKKWQLGQNFPQNRFLFLGKLVCMGSISNSQWNILVQKQNVSLKELHRSPLTFSSGSAPEVVQWEINDIKAHMTVCTRCVILWFFFFFFFQFKQLVTVTWIMPRIKTKTDARIHSGPLKKYYTMQRKKRYQGYRIKSGFELEIFAIYSETGLALRFTEL